MAELLTREKLFRGSDHIDQMKRIMAVVGTPEEGFIANIRSADSRNFLRQQPEQPRIPFRTILGARRVSDDAIDLLERMLVLDPDRRITVDNALAHPYCADFHDPSDEPIAHPIDLSFEGQNLPTERWRELIFAEIQQFSAE